MSDHPGLMSDRLKTSLTSFGQDGQRELESPIGTPMSHR